QPGHRRQATASQESHLLGQGRTWLIIISAGDDDPATSMKAADELAHPFVDYREPLAASRGPGPAGLSGRNPRTNERSQCWDLAKIRLVVPERVWKREMLFVDQHRLEPHS